MGDKWHQHKDTFSWPLWNNGSFTWNKKTRQLIFMRAGSPENPRPEIKFPTSFYVEGDDIKRLYQVLQEHYMTPRIVGGGNHTRDWNPDLPHPKSTTREANLCED